MDKNETTKTPQVGGADLNGGLDVTTETKLFMDWACSQPVELEEKHLEELGFWCWQAWQARAKLTSNS